MITTAPPRRPASRAVAISPAVGGLMRSRQRSAACAARPRRRASRAASASGSPGGQFSIAKRLESRKPAGSVAAQLDVDVERYRGPSAQVGRELNERAAVGEVDEGAGVEQHPLRPAGDGDHQSGSGSRGVSPSCVTSPSTVARSRRSASASRSRSIRPAAYAASALSRSLAGSRGMAFSRWSRAS